MKITFVHCPIKHIKTNFDTLTVLLGIFSTYFWPKDPYPRLANISKFLPTVIYVDRKKEKTTTTKN